MIRKHFYPNVCVSPDDQERIRETEVIRLARKQGPCPYRLWGVFFPDRVSQMVRCWEIVLIV